MNLFHKIIFGYKLMNEAGDGMGAGAPPPPEPQAQAQQPVQQPQQPDVAAMLTRMEQTIQHLAPLAQAGMQALQQQGQPAPQPQHQPVQPDLSMVDPAIVQMLENQQRMFNQQHEALAIQNEVVSFQNTALQLGLSPEEVQAALQHHANLTKQGLAKTVGGKRMTPLDVHYFIEGQKAVAARVAAKAQADLTRRQQNAVVAVEAGMGKGPTLPADFDQLSPQEQANHPQAWQKLDEQGF